MNRLIGPETKVKRAKQHIKDLQLVLKAFFDTDPYKVETKRDPETRKPIYYLTSVAETPPEIAAITGEVLQSLRSALDYLAYQLVASGTGRDGPFKWVEFPIFDSADEYESRKARKIQGMRKEAEEAIDAVKPYKGGNDTLWKLHKLNVVDKHRLLITVGSFFQSVDIGGHMIHQMQRDMPDHQIPSLSAFFRVADTMYPLKAGDELFLDAPDAEINQELKFRFGIALSEPVVVEGEPLIETLQQMVDLVDDLVPRFVPLLV